ncbi:MAG: sigma-70 family RNA polymerase sigma factor [Rikenellaceae bacterium]
MEVILLEDSELVERSLSGESACYEALFERHRGSLFAMLLKRSDGDRELSGDILQEAFIKAYVNLEKFDPKYSFAQWIKTIAKNLLMDHQRRVENRPKQNTENLEVIAPTPNPEEYFMGKEDKKRVARALDSLPEPYKTIIEMRFFRDLSYEEISEKLSIPMGTVKTQIYRARKLFIQLLG